MNPGGTLLKLDQTEGDKSIMVEPLFLVGGIDAKQLLIEGVKIWNPLHDVSSWKDGVDTNNSSGTVEQELYVGLVWNWLKTTEPCADLFQNGYL